MNRQNYRTHTEWMMTVLIALKYPPNRRIFLDFLSPVQGTVDLISSCCSHEEASVLQWTFLYSPTRRVENDEEYIDSMILFDREKSFLWMSSCWWWFWLLLNEVVSAVSPSLSPSALKAGPANHLLFFCGNRSRPVHSQSMGHLPVVNVRYKSPVVTYYVLRTVEVIKYLEVQFINWKHAKKLTRMKSMKSSSNILY